MTILFPLLAGPLNTSQISVHHYHKGIRPGSRVIPAMALVPVGAFIANKEFGISFIKETL